MARLAPLDLAALTPDQQRVADAIRSGPRGGMRGPFEAWLRSPGLADPAQQLGAHCRFATGLPNDLVELVILVTGAFWRAQFEFWAHARLGRAAGLPDDVIEAIRTGANPPLAREDLRVAYDLVFAALHQRRVPEATYGRAVATLGEKGVVEVMGIAGYYSLVSLTLNTFEVELPAGETPPFAD